MKNYKLVCFDLDDTILNETESIWKTIFYGLGCGQKDRDFGIKQYKEGKFSYMEWAEYDRKIWLKNKATKKKIEKIVKENISLMPGTIETLRELKKHNIKLAVISGGLLIGLKALLPNYKDYFDDVFVNEIIFDKKGIPIKIEAPFDSERKDLQLMMIAEKEHIDLKETVFIGDHDNDIHACEIAGLSIAFCPNSKKLEEVCEVVIKKKDLREVLKFIV